MDDVEMGRPICGRQGKALGFNPRTVENFTLIEQFPTSRLYYVSSSMNLPQMGREVARLLGTRDDVRWK